MFAVFGILYRYESTGRRRTDMSQPLLQIQPLEDDALSKSARHKTIQQATHYYQNCLSKWEDCGFHVTDMWPLYKCSPWKSIFYASGKYARKNPNASTRTNKAVTELADWYVKVGLGFSADYTWKEAYKRALHRSPTATPLELLRALHKSLIPPEKQKEAEILLSDCLRDALVAGSQQCNGYNTTRQQDESHQQVSIAETATVAEMNIVTPEQNNKRKRTDGEDEEARKQQRNWMREKRRAGPEQEQESLSNARQEVADATGDNKEVILKLKEVVARYRGRNTGFVPRDFQWLRRLRTSLGNVEKCIANCHGGDEEAFLRALPKVNKLSYRCFCATRK